MKGQWKRFPTAGANVEATFGWAKMVHICDVRSWIRARCTADTGSLSRGTHGQVMIIEDIDVLKMLLFAFRLHSLMQQARPHLADNKGVSLLISP